MKQVLFVLNNDKVGYWKLQRGQLSRASLKGDTWLEFSSAYWDDWKTANQVSGGLDAIFLSSQPDGFGDLPKWLCPPASEKPSVSDWTYDDLRMLSEEVELAEKGLVVVQGGIERTLSEGENPVKLHLSSSLQFELPKEEIKIKTPPEEVKETIVIDCITDEKSRLIKVGDVIAGKVKAYSPFRGSYIDSASAGDLFCIKPEEVDKYADYAGRFKCVGCLVELPVVSLCECDNKIKFTVEVKNQ